MRRIWTKTHRDDEHGKMLEVFLVGESQDQEVTAICTITKEKRFGSKTFSPARVNWAGWGAQESALALEFAGALTYAAHLAATLDAEATA